MEFTPALKVRWAVGAAVALAMPAAANPLAPIPIRCPSVELHYRVHGATGAGRVELWYTRDRAAWQRYGTDADGVSPLVFIAPGEGLYGFTLRFCDERHPSSRPPSPSDTPQRWVFIDYTPPLGQWDRVEPADDFPRSRTVYLRWTAHDDHLLSRPVSIAYQCSVDQVWHVIDAEVPNTGRYDWVVPKDAAGHVTLRLTLRDQGEHVVERLYGPVPLERWIATSLPLGSATQPAASVGPPPAGRPATQPAAHGAAESAGTFADSATITRRRQAEDLHRQGRWHLDRGQHDLAAQRFLEALDLEPGLAAARNDLAGVRHDQKDYAQALKLYQQVLGRDEHDARALRGTALAYVALKQYPQSRQMLERLLSAKQQDAETWLDLGDVLFMMGDQDGALGHWHQAATVDMAAAAIMGKAQRRLRLYGAEPQVTTADRAVEP